MCSDDERHVLLVRQLCLLSEPEAVVDGEGVDRDRQVLRVDLGELLPARVVPENKKKTTFILVVFSSTFCSGNQIAAWGCFLCKDLLFSYHYRISHFPR